MPILFSASELLNIAIEIERKDLAFYESLARSSGETRVCSSCNYFAGMEREHVRLFQGMLETIGEYSLTEDVYMEEYGLYLRSLVDSVAFTEDRVRNVVKKGIGDAEAIRIALSAEKDSILFY